MTLTRSLHQGLTFVQFHQQWHGKLMSTMKRKILINLLSNMHESVITCLMLYSSVLLLENLTKPSPGAVGRTSRAGHKELEGG